MLLLLYELEENLSQARDASSIKAFHCPTKNSTKEAEDLLDASFWCETLSSWDREVANNAFELQIPALCFWFGGTSSKTLELTLQKHSQFALSLTLQRTKSGWDLSRVPHEQPFPPRLDGPQSYLLYADGRFQCIWHRILMLFSNSLVVGRKHSCTPVLRLHLDSVWYIKASTILKMCSR